MAVPQRDVNENIWSAEPQQKRKGDLSKWSKNVAKKKRDSGEEYVSDKTKRVVPARSVGPPCICTKKCYDRVGADNVERIFVEYWKMASHNAQSSYLANLVESKEVCIALIIISFIL